MKWRPKWTTVALALGLIAAVGIASPVFGVSLRKLVKKEVAKQLAGKTGPAGLPGAAGANGASGANGTARAYAHVAGGTGAIIGGQSFGGIATGRNGAGEYCIAVPFTPNNIIATVDDFGTTPVAVATGDVQTTVGGCGGIVPGSNAFVITRREDTGAGADRDFFVMVN